MQAFDVDESLLVFWVYLWRDLGRFHQRKELSHSCSVCTDSLWLAICVLSFLLHLNRCSLSVQLLREAVVYPRFPLSEAVLFIRVGAEQNAEISISNFFACNCFCLKSLFCFGVWMSVSGNISSFTFLVFLISLQSSLQAHPACQLLCSRPEIQRLSPAVNRSSPSLHSQLFKCFKTSDGRHTRQRNDSTFFEQRNTSFYTLHPYVSVISRARASANHSTLSITTVCNQTSDSTDIQIHFAWFQEIDIYTLSNQC